jgi:hypothetical protein
MIEVILKRFESPDERRLMEKGTYRRLARRGKKRALVALGRTLLVIAYSVRKRGTTYQELGEDPPDRQRSERRTRPGEARGEPRTQGRPRAPALRCVGRAVGPAWRKQALTLARLFSEQAPPILGAGHPTASGPLDRPADGELAARVGTRR